MRKRLLSNLAWLVAGKGFRVVGLIIGIWMARYLGPEQYGVLSYAYAFVALFGTIAKLGLDQLAVRNITQSPEKEGLILGTVFVLKLVTSLIAFVLVLLTSWFLQNGDWTFTVLVMVIAVGFMFNAFDAYDIYHQAHVTSRYVVISTSAAILVLSAVRVGLILGEYPILYFAATSTFELAFRGVLMVLIGRRKRRTSQKWHFDMSVTRGLLKDGWPIVIGSVMYIIHTRIDQVMIGSMLGSDEVGIYSAAVRLSELWLFMPMLIVQTLMPYFTRIRMSNTVHYHARLTQLYSLMFWLGALVGIVTTIFGETIVIAIYGEAYQNAYAPLALSIWTGVFIAQSSAMSVWMIGENILSRRLVISLIVVPINIGLNLLLIPKYGIIGASAASFISTGLGVWVVSFMVKPLRAQTWQMLRAINPRYLIYRIK